MICRGAVPARKIRCHHPLPSLRAALPDRPVGTNIGPDRPQRIVLITWRTWAPPFRVVAVDARVAPGPAAMWSDGDLVRPHEALAVVVGLASVSSSSKYVGPTPEMSTPLLMAAARRSDLMVGAGKMGPPVPAGMGLMAVVSTWSVWRLKSESGIAPGPVRV